MLSGPWEQASEEPLQLPDPKDIAQDREEFPIVLRHRPLVHLLNERDDLTLVIEEVAPLKARDGERDGNRPDRRDVFEKRVEPGREIRPEGDHQDPERGDSGRNGALDSIPRVAFLDRGQEELERLDFRLPIVGAVKLCLQDLPLGPFGGSTTDASHDAPSRFIVSYRIKSAALNGIIVSVRQMTSRG